MKYFVGLLCIFAILLALVSFYWNYSHTRTSAVLYNAYLSSEHVSAVDATSSDSASIESSEPVSCVLSYGTFMVNQQDCDVLTDSDVSQNLSEETVSCTIAEGTFSVGKKECLILQRSKGSRDVMRSLDH